MKHVRKLVQTCSFCPSQWEGEFVDGSPLYIRYRWGYLSMREGVSGPELFGEQVGDAFHGVMSTQEMLALTGLRLVKGLEIEEEGPEAFYPIKNS